MKMTRALTLFVAFPLLALVLLALPISTARAADPAIVRVKVNGATSGPCGTSWANACGLQHALTSILGPSIELWVASGTYTPTTSEVDPRLATFRLRNGFALYGGFAMTETLRAQRNFTANVTVLSGDIGTPAKSGDNSYHVVTGSGTNSTAILDGFTVTGGNANGTYPYDSGGGMYNDAGSPTLANVTFFGNSATYFGGGMDNFNGSSPTLTNVTFSSNSSPLTGNGGGMANEPGCNPVLANVTFSGNSSPTGGGMYNYLSNPTLTNVVFSNNTSDYGGGLNNDSSSPVLTNVTFSGNSATQTGGGIRGIDSSPILTNVTFINNTASDSGGGMYSDGGNPTLTDVTFSGNSTTNYGGGMNNVNNSPMLTNITFFMNTANSDGGGIYNNSSNPTLMNVTFSGNSATNSGGGMYNNSSDPTLTNVTLSGNAASNDGGGMYNDASSPTIRNTIVWGNTPNNQQIYDASGTPIVSDSVVQGDYAGGNNIITADPHLGALGNWGGSTQTIRILVGSSAIDAGNSTACASIPTDQRGKPRFGTCDIGAFEFQGYALAKTGGDPQSAHINTAFANPLQVTLTEIDTGLLTPSIVVTFTAPSSGASAAWSGSRTQTATTNASGVAAVAPPMANGIAGSYAVIATAAGANPPATFSLTNLLNDLHLPLIRK